LADTQAVQASLDAYQWLHLLGLGGFAGMLGQGARTIVGLKKMNDSASAETRMASDLLDVSRLLTSLAIGFVAGALAAVPLLNDLAHVSAQQIFALAASGYAGADFIEGFMTRILGAQGSPDGLTVGGGVPFRDAVTSDDAVG